MFTNLKPINYFNAQTTECAVHIVIFANHVFQSKDYCTKDHESYSRHIIGWTERFQFFFISGKNFSKTWIFVKNEQTSF